MLMSSASNVFVGITTWNSELLLPICLDSLRNTAPDAEVVVFDNMSTDRTRDIARSFGARVVARRSGQADALDALASMSRKPYTLLIHADVVFMAPEWADTVVARLKGSTALVSPEDIGCGPYTRPWGKDKPESSFMCFSTQHIGKLKTRQWARRFGFPYFRNRVDFYGDHVTYGLPGRLVDAGLQWCPMKVHVSEFLRQPYYTPDFPLQHWTPELGHLRYGLGNFYSLDGVVTHYHNWYDRRVDKTKQFDPHETLEVGGGGVPVAYLKAYTTNFIDDYTQNRVSVPDLMSTTDQYRIRS